MNTKDIPAQPAKKSNWTDAQQLDFDAVFDEELEKIQERRQKNRANSTDSPRDNLFGLALSGGGIRSATFNLGLIQALARFRLLTRIDYMSVNSGGGYIGGWLAAWIKRDGIDHVQDRLGHRTGARSARSRLTDVDANLSTNEHAADHQFVQFLKHFASSAMESIQQLGRREGSESGDEMAQTIEPEPYPIAHLRRYTNYLTPRVGLFSIDTWVLVATYFRNFLLNLVVIGLASTALIYFVRFAVHVSKPVSIVSESMTVLSMAGLLLLLLALTTFGHLTRPSLVPTNINKDGDDEDVRIFADAKRVFFANPQGFIVLPTFIASVLIAKLNIGHVETILGRQSEFLPIDTNNPHAALGIYFLCVWLILSTLIFWRHIRSPTSNPEYGIESARVQRVKTVFLIAIISVVTTIVSVSSTHFGLQFLQGRLPIDESSIVSSLRLVFGAPIVVCAIYAINITFIGLSGRLLTEQQRQWWSRLGAWLLIYSLIWILLIAIVDLSPLLISGKNIGGLSITSILLIIWPTLSAAGAYSGHRLEAYQEAAGIAKRLFMQAAPLIFIFGLLVFNANIAPDVVSALSAKFFQGSQIVEFATSNRALGALIMAAVLIGLTYALSSRIDVNEFSMHNFYRARLVRAFLGASRGDRDADPFTDFSRRDDVPLTQLAFQSEANDNSKYDGPIPIYNCSLNLVASDRLALQERKADSFAFTPYHFGYHYRPTRPTKHTVDYMGKRVYVSVAEPSYRRTEEFGTGISTGMAMAVSGAAISPNMGFRSTSTLAFLLTVFNVRLGAWVINPRKKTKSKRLSPRLGFASLLGEMFARTNENTDYVYLSDGGHFENLAVYELIRRRCRYVIVSDAAADPNFGFLDLGNLIRKCRSDFGINIEIDLSEVRPDESGISKNHFAVGQIRYDQAYPGEQPGFLVYIKSSLTGRESVDIAAYRREHPTFPHQSTADQWFTESQFDSYRTLGFQVGMSIFRTCGSKNVDRLPLETFFSHLRRAAYPASSRVLENFTNHATKLQELLADLSGDPQLEFLDRQLFPDSYRFGREYTDVKKTIPDSTDDFRRGFYFCNRLLQLMENVFIDMNLEREWRHPDNRGWFNLFNYWTSSDMLRLTWSLSASTYGARFQRFCEERFELGLGDVSAQKTDISGMDADDISNLNLKSGPTTLKERLRIETLIRQREDMNVDVGLKCFWVFVIEIRIEVAKSEGDTSNYRLPCGFAITDQEDNMVFMRIRDHLRGLGLARRALEAMQKQGQMPLKMAPESRSLYEEIARDPENGRYFELLLYSLASLDQPLGDTPSFTV